jgi:hypothetical protein
LDVGGEVTGGERGDPPVAEDHVEIHEIEGLIVVVWEGVVGIILYGADWLTFGVGDWAVSTLVEKW